jgi:hypothetical protein
MDNKLSILFNNQVSDYILEEYPDFIIFLKSYYEWMEESGNSLEFLQTYKDNIDIDLSDVEFTNSFLQELVGFISNIEFIDEKTLIRYVKEFYLAKGSHESFRFIFNLLFNSELSIVYPREYIFKSSDSIWTGDTVIKTTNENFYKVQIPKDAHIKIVGLTSNSVAIVDKTEIKSSLDGTKYVEFELSSFDKKFILNENVVIYINDISVFERLYSQVLKFDISDSVSGGFSKNDKIEIKITTPNKKIYNFDGYVFDVYSGGLTNYTIVDGGSGCVVGQRLKINDVTGYGFSAFVSRVDENTGEVLEIEIVTSGYSYRESSYILTFETNSGIVPENPTYGTIVVSNPDIGKIKKIKINDGGFIEYTNNMDIGVYINDVLVPEITPIFDVIFYKQKEYKNESGFTSFNNHLQDSFYYQDFSYVLKNEISIKKWQNLVKKILHTAGSELFSQWVNTNIFSLEIKDVETIVNMIVKIIVEHLDGSGINIDINRDTITLDISNGIGIVGNNYHNLDSLKFLEFFNWEIETFFELSINDIENVTDTPMEFGYSSITLI